MRLYMILFKVEGGWRRSLLPNYYVNLIDAQRVAAQYRSQFPDREYMVVGQEFIQYVTSTT